MSYEVTSSDIRRWALATYWPESPPAHYLVVDDDAIVAPEDFNPFAWAVVSQTAHPAAQRIELNDPDRTEMQIGVPGPGLKYQLNGGVAVEYGVSIRVGDVLTSVTTLDAYSERDGRLGHMLMTTTADTWTNQRDELVKRSRTTLIRY